MLKKPTCMLSMLYVLLIFLITGCASHHVPHPDAIDLPEYPAINSQSGLQIINNQDNSEAITFGSYGAGKLVGDLKTWTGSAVEIVRESLKKKGAVLSDNSSKKLNLSITDARVGTAGVPMVASLASCKIILKAETGEGYSNIYEETSKAMNPPWACDAAMKSVVSSLLNDKTILSYISE